MVDVKNRRQPLIQLLHEDSDHCKPRFNVGTTIIVPLYGMHRTVQLLLPTPQPDCSRWYMSIMIDMNPFKVLYLEIIQRGG
jgi:hypothetical protein